MKISSEVLVKCNCYSTDKDFDAARLGVRVKGKKKWYRLPKICGNENELGHICTQFWNHEGNHHSHNNFDLIFSIWKVERPNGN